MRKQMEMGFVLSVFLVVCAVTDVRDLRAETIVTAAGQEMRGRIGDFSQNGIQFHEERYFFLQLTEIRDAWVDPGVTGEELKRQQANIERLLKVIDKEKFLKKDFGRHIRDLLSAKKYDELDRIAEDLLQKGERFPSGDWKVTSFFIEIKKDISDRDVANYLKRAKLIEDWIAQKPNSTAAKIALMGVLRDLAWAYRGSGYSNTITDDGAKNFKASLARVIGIGHDLRAAGVKNPVLYIYLISAANGYGVDKETIKDLAKESADIHPEYFITYFAAMSSLLPRWGGAQGEVEEFADWVSTVTGKPQDLEMYYRVVKDIKEMIQDRRYKYFDFDWAKIQQGFKEYQKNYPAIDKDFHLMAKLACLHGDRAAARKYFALIDGEWNHFAKAQWDRPEQLAQFQKWSKEAPDTKFAEILKSILEEGAPLVAALINEYTDEGGDINKTDAHGNTLLQLAVERGGVESTKHLIKLGANVNRTNPNGYSPLHLAAQYGNAEIAQILLDNGADVKAVTKQYEDTPLHFAAGYGFVEVSKVLLDHDASLINAPDKSLLTPLHQAANDGHANVVRLFLTYKNLNINAQTLKGNTAVHLAAIRGHGSVISLLVDSGADLSIMNRNNHTALSVAREQGFDSIVTYLQGKGAADSLAVVSEESRRMALKVYEEASKYFSSENYQKAQELYWKSLEYNPNYSIAYTSLALIAWQFERNLEKADEYIRKAIEINPNDVENYYLRGRINYDLKRPDVYRPLFQKYVQLAPDTYNTKDLKQNYEHLLTDSPQPPTGPKAQNDLRGSNPLTANPKLNIYILLALFGLLIVVKLVGKKGR